MHPGQFWDTQYATWGKLDEHEVQKGNFFNIRKVSEMYRNWFLVKNSTVNHINLTEQGMTAHEV